MQNENQLPVFVIDPEPEVDWPVIVKLPADGGAIEAYQFIGRFKVLSHAEWDAVLVDKPAGSMRRTLRAIARLFDKGPSFNEQLAEDAKKFVKVMTGWDGPVDRRGHAVPFSPETLTVQATGPRGLALSDAIWTALTEIRWGGAAKNSAPPPAAG